MLKRFADWLALTGTERKVLMFLTITLAIGAGIRFVRFMNPSAPAFDYGASDSTFTALSTPLAEAEEPALRTPVARTVNINTATREELNALPGIGDVTAGRILAYRTGHGAFRTVEELTKVQGITRNKLQRLRPLITVATPKGELSP